MSLSEGDDGKILVFCHAGCDQEEVIQALKDLDLWPYQGSIQASYSSTSPKGKFEIAYGYLDESGRLLFESCRYKEPKAFKLRRREGDGGYIYNIKDIRLVPYQLPEVLKPI